MSFFHLCTPWVPFTQIVQYHYAIVHWLCSLFFFLFLAILAYYLPILALYSRALYSRDHSWKYSGWSISNTSGQDEQAWGQYYACCPIFLAPLAIFLREEHNTQLIKVLIYLYLNVSLPILVYIFTIVIFTEVHGGLITISSFLLVWGPYSALLRVYSWFWD